MEIIIDAMGGDRAPEEIVCGAADAARGLSVKIVLVGKSDVVEPLAKKYDFPEDRLEIVHADTAITMEDDPMTVVRTKKDSSMALGLRMLKERGDAFVSAGNTGALLTGASLIVRPIKGIKRPAIATLLPFKPPVLMLDCGANTNVISEYMETWAILGSLYMENVCGVKNPRVGLLNNGTESHKGTALAAETYGKLSALPGINFVGNIEGSMIPQSPCDVLVTDGFTGNVTLKLIEGMGKFTFSRLREMFTGSLLSKLAYLAVKPGLISLKNDFDASEAGGAPLLGLSRPVIKAHGSSDARAIFNAVRQAVKFAECGLIPKICDAAEQLAQTRDALINTDKGKV